MTEQEKPIALGSSIFVLIGWSGTLNEEATF